MTQLQQQSTTEDAELASVLGRLKDKFHTALKTLQFFQSRNSEFVFNTGWFPDCFSMLWKAYSVFMMFMNFISSLLIPVFCIGLQNSINYPPKYKSPPNGGQ